MDAKVTVEYVIRNIGDEKEVEESAFDSFEEMVLWLIDEEGIFGICNDNGTVVKVEKINEAKANQGRKG